MWERTVRLLRAPSARSTRFVVVLPALIACALLAAACDSSSSPRATATLTGAPPSPTAAAPTATLVPGSGTASSTPSATAAASATASPPPRATATNPPPPSSSTPVPSATATPTGTPLPTSTPPPVVAHVTVATGVPVRLAQGVIADLPGGRTLTLLDVTADSRCPADVQCIWAGEANLVFEWTVPGATHRVPLVVSPVRGSAELPGGFVLRALSLAPATTSGRTIRASEYVVTVVVDPPGAATAGAYGNVTVGPSCPVQREGVPCPDRPLAATLVIRNAAGAEVARAQSDSTGFYSVALAPGHYTIVPFTPGGATLPRGIPRDIDVPVGGWIVADVMYDSGIR